MKYLFISFSILLLIYMLWPGPSQISDFPPLPSSAKSTLSGDTIEIPDVAGYFSNNFRSSVIPFYSKEYQQKTNLPFPPLRLNHPPEFSWTAIKKHTDSTYLGEFVYPLRDSLYVNGFELFRPDGTPIFWGAPRLEQDDQYWQTKVTLRFYPSSILIRMIIWLGIVISVMLIYQQGRRVIKE